MRLNPFKYGELSMGENFCNRQLELKRLHADFRDGQSIVLISPRRWGKSSLVNQAIHSYKGKICVVKLDCFGLRSSDEFYSVLLKSVLLATSSKVQQLADTIGNHIKPLIPFIKYSIGDADQINIALELPKSKVDAGAVLDLSQKIAHQKKIRMVICVDEFQKVAEWQDGKITLEKLRSHWQKHKDVSYCLYGSKRHIMSTLFSDSSQPFYRFGETIFLPRIAENEWVAFLLREFRKSGKKIKKEIARELVSLVNAHSYYVQYLARICWNNSAKDVTSDTLESSYLEMLVDHEALFQNITKGLTKYQVNYLRAFIAGESQMTSQRVLNHYDLGSPGNINRIEAAFEDMEVLDFSTPDAPQFCDPYFEPLFRRYFIDSL